MKLTTTFFLSFVLNENKGALYSAPYGFASNGPTTIHRRKSPVPAR